MDAPHKLAFVVQANRLQGLMWQALLKSQKLAVILEPTSSDLADCINQIASAGLTLPDVIVLDAEAADLNPYEFCRWCRESFPKMQIFLTRCQQLRVSDTERRWAKQQGATDFLSGFDRDSLMFSATGNVKTILTSLDYPFLNEKALLTVLLNIRRQLGTTQASPVARAVALETSAGASAKLTVQGNKSEDKTTPDPLNDVDWVASGLRALNKKAAAETAKESFAPPPAVKSSALPKALPADEMPTDSSAVRRYRGVVY